jgi:hypothetical protein
MRSMSATCLRASTRSLAYPMRIARWDLPTSRRPPTTAVSRFRRRPGVSLGCIRKRAGGERDGHLFGVAVGRPNLGMQDNPISLIELAVGSED